jgi:UrcA family protein
MYTPSLAAALGLTLMLPAGAVAQSLFNEPQEEHRLVEYGDLDLTLPSAGRELYVRITAAAADACANRPSTDLLELSLREDCFRAAVQGAVNQVDQPTVTASHLETFAWAKAPGTSAANRLAEGRP